MRRIVLSLRAGGRGVGRWLVEEGISSRNVAVGLSVGVVEREDRGSRHRLERPMHYSGTSSASSSTSAYSSSSSSPSLSSSQLPAPGAPLKKATQHDTSIGGRLQQSRSPKPTHHAVFHAPNRNPEESARRKVALKSTLEKYKTDLVRGKNGGNSAPSPDALPFLEDTITHLVGREQNMLLFNSARDAPLHSKDDMSAAFAGLKNGKGSPSRVRAMAMAEALRGGGYYGAFGMAEAGLVMDWDARAGGERQVSPQSRRRQSYIQKANAIIGIISAVEARVALTREQAMAVARAAAEQVQSEHRGRADDIHGDDGIHRVHVKAKPSPDDVLDCLQLLDQPDETVSRIISAYPTILFLDVDMHMLPILAYLSDLGLDDAEIADVVSAHPSIFKPSNEHTLQSGVAFWAGKGLSRASIVNLIKLDPSILETNKLVMQMKVDWLTEHTGLTVEQLATEPRTLSANLGAVTAPRIAWLVKENKVQVGDFGTAVLSDIVGDEHFEQANGFLERFDGEASSYEAFVSDWYPRMFVPWLERKSRMSEILLQEESDMVELGGDGGGAGGDETTSIAMQAFAAGKEFAWEQQMEREREWHMAWHAWKREQQSMALAERATKRHELREQGLSGSGVAASVNSLGLNGDAKQTGSVGDAREPLGNAVATRRQPLATVPGASNIMFTGPISSPWPNTSPASLSSACQHQRSVYFLSRKWTCDATIDEALSQAVADCQQSIPAMAYQATAVESFDPEILSTLSIERVQSCAVNLLLLLRASEFGTLEPRVFNAWASRSGVAIPELTAAKAIISSKGAACVRSEPSWKYHNVPQKVWRLRDTAFYAPGLLPLRDTRGSRAVTDLAELILESLKQNPDNEPMTRMEISDMYDNKPEFQSKRMRFAIGLLLEQGMVIQRRRRGIASGPMELVLTESFLTPSLVVV